jgi:ABC-2 type transport system ATP-binding protein
MQDIEKTCNRLVIISEGSKIYDGTLDGVRKLHGSSRQLDVFFMNDSEVAKIPDVEIIEVDKRHSQLIFDGKKVHINDLMSHLLGVYNVKDINISEPDIESIIRKIYSREKVA